MPTVDVKNLAGQVVGSVQLSEPVFTDRVKMPLLWQTVKGYQANRRQGTASTKTRSDVRGGGRKPWKQKGTGRARAGTIRSPLWRGGGVVFGPHPRDYRVHLPKMVRQLALLSSLEAKWQDGAVTVVKDFQLSAPKTKQVAQALATLKLEGKTLILLDQLDPIVARAARNLHGVTVKPAMQATAYEILAHRHLLVSETGLQQLQALKHGLLARGPYSRSVPRGVSASQESAA